MKNRQLYRVYILSFFIFAGCMGGRTLTLDIRYDAEREPKPLFAAENLKITVIPFDDVRQQKEIGKWTGLRSKIDTFEPAKPLEDAVTGAVAEYLRKSGFDVAIAEKGQTAASFKEIPPHFVFSGAIEDMKAEAVSYAGYTQVKINVRLKVSIKNIKDESTVHLDIESLSEPKTVVTFNPEIFEDTLNEAFSDGIERILASINLEGEILQPKK